ncbi:hypothetical protein VNO78_25267 [Psophocarpus tetragonolobus]|uniref:RNase H type-1 domain-containing protein n=1 Tax=Psophocarpus tetragonolobus TaxID=3891 RepID=A0AAN9XF60_PSOTE
MELSLFMENKAPVRGVVRDWKTNFILVSPRPLKECSELEVELFAIKIGMKLVILRGYKKLIIESDSLVTVQMINGLVKRNISCHDLVSSIIEMTKNFDQIYWNHVFREANSVTSGLTKYELSLSQDLRELSYVEVFDLLPHFILDALWLQLSHPFGEWERKRNMRYASLCFNSISMYHSPKCPLKLLLLPSSKPNRSPPVRASHQPGPTSSSDPAQTLISLLRSIPDWADAVQERGMRKKRTLYTHHNWRDHRSSLRHIRHVVSSLSSRVVLSLVPPVLFFTAFAAAIAAYNQSILLHLLPEFLPLLRTSSLPYQLTAPALALLLVFRTEASYSRFVEGKKAWTKVIAATHDFSRQVAALAAPDHADFLLKHALLQYITAFPIALKCHVLYGSDVRRDLQHLLEVDDLAVVVSSKHRPHCIIEFISQTIQLLKLEESRRNFLESKISCFHEGIGICEQLMGIPIPLAYTRLTSRFLVLWHLTLPIILWDDCHWIVVPATFISAASLFCIEEVGVLIEEPFPTLALDDLCLKAQKDIQEAITTGNLIHARLVAKQNCHSEEHSSNGWPNS